jgi:LmbE family N-acetylglucosaminyl deacetylase
MRRRQGTCRRLKTSLPRHGRIVVLSPHLDDAALSLGACIATATRAGAEVRVVTVFAYDPSVLGDPAEWDAACGFRSLQEAARARRAEDKRASEILGCTPVWLPYLDAEYGELHPEDGAIESAVADAVDGADCVLLPGYPLVPPDHLRLTRLILERPPSGARIGLYVEQPYATLGLMSRGGRAGAEGLTTGAGLLNSLRIAGRMRGGRRLQEPEFPAALAELVRAPPQWGAAPATRSERHLKQRAIRAYRSQVRGFGPLVLPRIALYESAWGGEGIAYVIPRASGSDETMPSPNEPAWRAPPQSR